MKNSSLNGKINAKGLYRAGKAFSVQYMQTEVIANYCWSATSPHNANINDFTYIAYNGKRTI